MRRILLWMARNRWLKEHLPRLPFARRAVRRFMPGETIEEALDAAEQFRAHGIGILLTHLGENLTDLAQARAVADHYHDVLDKVRARGLDAEISLKLTQIGLDLDPEVTFGHLSSLAAHAAEAHGTLWIDMESSAYVNPTLDLYRRLLAEHPNSGVCLQAYLRRTPTDVHELLPLRPKIRLVKGAYDEPERIAFRRRLEVDAAYQSLAVLMLPAAARGELRLGLGTHDVGLIERIAAHAKAAGIGKEAFEVQMLYGIRMAEQRRLAAEGYVVRDLIAYGDAWYAWYMRRLAERPANVLFALRQILP
ncbi:MAG TPA: proline dehydrogenase family protein [candidate division Zixibacteria bacterium]|nr:proline dehydrogenase family protein [candidate division Zixibacteria bacterium]